MQKGMSREEAIRDAYPIWIKTQFFFNPCSTFSITKKDLKSKTIELSPKEYEWLNPTEMQSYQYISSKLQDTLTTFELILFSRIVILAKDDPAVAYLLSLETISNGGFKELRAEELSEKFKFVIKRAYLLRSQKPHNNLQSQ